MSILEKGLKLLVVVYYKKMATFEFCSYLNIRTILICNYFG